MTAANAAEVRLYTAASTAPLLEHLKPIYEAESGDTLLIVPASSAVLARQIDAGADADLFLSANRAWADYIAERHTVSPENRMTWLGNALVLAVPQGTPVSDAPLTKAGFGPLIHDRPLAICDPDSVPCGIYAKQALETLGLWDVAQEAKIIRGANALATTAWIERGEAGAGVIYQTDALQSDNLIVAAVIPPESHDPVLYELVILSPDDPAVARFRAFLTSDNAQEAAKSFGFTVPATNR